MAFLNSILFYICSIAFLFQSIINLPIVETKDTIFPGDSLDSKSVLISPRGKFTMGFFLSTYNNLTYLGIWYTNAEHDKKVWIANRDMPIVGNGTLSLDESGTLRLMNRNGATLFNVFNGKVGSDNENYITRATLEDSGNFIVYRANRTIWQSFDHPTDTLIPGMKIGYNLTTGRNWTLTSSTDNGFLASGVFTLKLELYKNSPQLIIHRRGQLYWASAPWNESGDFVYRNFWNSYNMNVISDASGMYFTLQTSVSSILQLSPAGYFVDNYLDNVEPRYFCYGYQTDDYGCAVSNGTMGVPYCRGTNDHYYWVPRDSFFGSFVVLSDYKTENDASISIGDCMERCWSDCNCQACSTYNNGTGCIYSTYNRRDHGDYLQGNVSRYYLRYSPYYEKTWRSELFPLLLVPIVVLAYVSIKRRIFKGGII